MQLYILLDVSPSMESLTYDAQYGYIKKIDMVKNHMLSFLNESVLESFSNVHLYTFASSNSKVISLPIGELKNNIYYDSVNQKKQINIFMEDIGLKIFGCGDGKKLWDNIYYLIKKIADNSDDKKTILCLTDGDDRGSSNDYNFIKELVDDDPTLNLIILDIDGKMNGVKEKDDKIIKTIKRPQDLNKVLHTIDIGESIKADLKTLDITVSVVPVIPCSDKELYIVRKAIQETVPYIEELTGLRYYPVPTLLVDEYTLNRYCEEPNPEINNDDVLKDTIYEFLRFLRVICNIIYNYNFENNFDEKRGNCYPQEMWNKYLKHNSDIMAAMKHFCSNYLGAYNYINEGSFKFEELDYYKSVKSAIFYNSEDDISKYEVMMYELIQYLSFLSELNYFSYQVDYKHFDHCHDNDQENDYPNLEVWKQNLSKRDYNKILSSINEDKSWNRNLCSVINVFKVSLPVLIKLLREWEKLSSKWSIISKEIRTFGVYLNSNTNDSKLRNLLENNNFPSHYQLAKGGKVLLCLDRCKKRLEDLLSNAPDELINSNDLFPRLIKATIIHEHTHAITYEGINNNDPVYFNNTAKRGGKKYKAVSETIAEWAEMNYFRNIGDELLYDIIFTHANYGQFPNWAYAGALILESSSQILPTEIKYRAILQYFRSDTNSAYRLLTS